MRKPALVFIFITLFLDVLGIGLIIPIVPTLVVTLQGTKLSDASHVVGLLSMTYSLLQFLFAAFLGSLSDRFGRRPVILISLFGSGVDYLMQAVAPTLPWFFIGRAINGLTGANFSVAGAYIADISPPEKRAANFGIIGAAFGLGFIAGPALGGLLAVYGPRVPFYAAAGLSLTNWLYGCFVLPESLAPENRRKFSWARSNPVGALLALRRWPVVIGLAATVFLFNMAQLGLQSVWVLYTVYRYHWTPKAVGISLAIVGFMAVLVQGGLVRRIIPKLGERKSVIFGMTSSVIAHVCYGLSTQGWMIYTVLSMGLLQYIAAPALQGIISRHVPANEQGGVQGTLSSLSNLAGIIAPPLATTLFGYCISEHSLLPLPGAPFFAGALLTSTGMLLAVRSMKKNAVA